MCVSCALFIHMQGLREQIVSLKEQLKRRECEWWEAHSHLRSRVDALSRENRALMSQCARPQSSGRSTPHPEAQNLVSSFTRHTPASTFIQIQSKTRAGSVSLSRVGSVFVLLLLFMDLWSHFSGIHLHSLKQKI